MPKTLHMYYLRKFYGENALAKGELVVDNVQLDLKKVKTPIYVQSSKEDHIAPARSVYKGAKLFGGPVTFTLAGSGHIAGALLMRRSPTNTSTGPNGKSSPDTLAEWQGQKPTQNPRLLVASLDRMAEELKSGGQVPARDPAKGKLNPLGDAPGTYVKVRS